MMDINDRIQKASKAHKSGYNCVQSVISGYSDLFESEEEILTLSMGLGRGIGASYEICGTALGGAIVISRKYGKAQADVKCKHEVENKIQEFINEFREEYGAVTCGELLGIVKRGAEVHKKPCHDMVVDIVKRLEKYVIDAE